MENYEVKPVTELTAEIIDELIIHPTLSSLRRAASVSPSMIRVEGSDQVPTLFYIKGVKDPAVDDWTIHALSSDINKFLLLGLIDDNPDPEPEPDPDFVKSTIKWDGVTGGTLTESVKDGFLILSGDIAWDSEEDPAGNYVGAIITVDQSSLTNYPEATYSVSGGSELKVTDNIQGLTLPIISKINVLGQEVPIKITWDETHVETFIMAVTQESNLMFPEGTAMTFETPSATAGTPVTSNATFTSSIEFKGVRFKFTAEGPGDVTFKATDSLSQEFTFTNTGYWGPETGFDVPAEYSATTPWEITFAVAGDYTVTTELIYAKDEAVIHREKTSVTVILLNLG